MRFDTPIYFLHIGPGEYNETTGNYEESEPTETKCYANVTDSGVEMLNLVYGELRQGSKVIRLLQAYNESFQYIRIGEKRYKVDFTRKLRNKQTFVVSEVQ